MVGDPVLRHLVRTPRRPEPVEQRLGTAAEAGAELEHRPALPRQARAAATAPIAFATAVERIGVGEVLRHATTPSGPKSACSPVISPRSTDG